MSIKSAVLAGTAALTLLFSAPFALAQANLNGTYSFSLINTCQADLGYTTSGGNVATVTATDPGTLEGTLASATFDGSGTVTISTAGQTVQGDMLTVTTPTPLAGSTPSSSLSYATTVSGNAGTFTLNGITYKAYFGQVDTNSVAHYMLFAGVPNGTYPNNCYTHGEAYMVPAMAPNVVSTSSTVTPKLVGTYIFQFYEYCQSTLSTTSDSQGLTGIGAQDPGALTALTGIAVFGPFPTGSPTVKASKMELTGFYDTGDLLLVNSTGNAITEQAIPGSAPQFSFTAGTKSLKLTLLKGAIGGNAQKIAYTLRANYGAISTGTTPDNVAGRVVFVGKAKGGCQISGKAMLVSTAGN